MNRTHALWLAGLVAGCASIQTVAYTVNPARISDPKAEVLTLIKANVRPGCIAEPAFEGTLLNVKFVCSLGVGSAVARLDKVESITLQQYEDWYRVLVHHTVGEDFSWTSKSLEDMQRLADALTALSAPSAPAPTTPTQSI
ncbi:MAG: hypothetical protein K1X89_06225 [Myxococcaceae bacterium]|nr:hypothetical protein [Myxococcaceae bacterium]